MKIDLRMDLTCDNAFGFSGQSRSHDPRMNAIHSHVRIHLLRDPKEKGEKERERKPTRLGSRILEKTTNFTFSVGFNIHLQSLSKFLGVQNVGELRDSISTCRVVLTGDTDTNFQKGQRHDH